MQRPTARNVPWRVAALIPFSLAGQASELIQGDTLLVHATLVRPFTDSTLVSLSTKGYYRLYVSPAIAEVRLVPVVNPARPAFTPRIANLPSINTAKIEVYPRTSAVHRFQVQAAPGIDTVSIWLWANAVEAAKFQAVRERAWSMGFWLAAGYPTGYRIETADPTPPSSSVDGEVGLLVGTSGVLSGVLGVDYQRRRGGANGIAWFFVEPRIRAHRFELGTHHLDALFTIRASRGAVDNVSLDPTLVAPGLLLSYRLANGVGSRGFGVSLHLQYAFLGRTEVTDHQSFIRGALGLSWLP